MATKRKAVEHASQQNAPRPSYKRPRPEYEQRPNHGKKSFKKAHPINELKNAVRSLRRFLEHNDDLPMSIRIEKERALQTAQHELEKTQRAKRKHEMIGKWHKIRFFERRKAERLLKKTKKELQACENEEEQAEIGKRVKEAEVDLNYALYFPLDQEYVPLWPRKKDGSEDDGPDAEGKTADRQGDADMWKTVEKCMKKGTLEDLREGRLTGQAEPEELVAPLSAKKAKRKKPVDGDDMAGMNRRQRRQEVKEEAEAEGNDGGDFFE